MGPGGVADPKTLAAECADRLKSADTFARHYLTGAVHFRAGAFSTALTELSRGEKFEPESVSPAVAWLFLAMTNHHLGKPDDARKWLARADEWYSRKATPAVPNTKPTEFESSILRKEAAAPLNIKW
jgi:hypothetical protein